LNLIHREVLLKSDVPKRFMAAVDGKVLGLPVTVSDID
jgi:hypothetical protein